MSDRRQTLATLIASVVWSMAYCLVVLGMLGLARKPDDKEEVERLDSELRRMAAPRDGEGGLRLAPDALLLLELRPSKDKKA